MSDKGRKYTAEGIVVYYQPRLCIHAAECVRGIPTVFDTQKRPWIQPEYATPDQIAEVVQRCPSGALQFERLDGGELEPTPAFVEIRAVENGPLYVRAPLNFQDASGAVIYQGNRAALCRCGASKNKPFCDNSHREIGFQAEASRIVFEVKDE